MYIQAVAISHVYNFSVFLILEVSLFRLNKKKTFPEKRYLQQLLFAIVLSLYPPG